MKKFYLVLTALVLAGCGTSPENITATAVMAQAQTQTAAPTPTSTLTPTFTPSPTSTSTSTPTPKPTNTPEPTPASVGGSINFDTLEITLLQVDTHSHIVPGGVYYYYAKKGYVFVELGVLVRNTGVTPIRMQIKDIYIVDESGKKWFSIFGTSKTVEVGRNFNPISISLTDTVNSGEEVIVFHKDTYLRLIFTSRVEHSLLFGIQDSPRFGIDVNEQ